MTYDMVGFLRLFEKWEILIGGGIGVGIGHCLGKEAAENGHYVSVVAETRCSSEAVGLEIGLGCKLYKANRV